MAGLDLLATQDVIASHIETTFSNYEVKQDTILDDESILKLDNKVKPFIDLRWHQLNRLAANASFAGVRHDEYNSAVDIIFVGPTPRIARQGLNMVMQELIGWQIPDGSQLTPEGGQSVLPVFDYNAKPHLYIAISTLSFQVNTSDIGA